MCKDLIVYASVGLPQKVVYRICNPEIAGLIPWRGVISA